MRRERNRTWLQAVSLDEEDVRQAVVILAEDGYPRPGSFDDGGLIQVSGDDHGFESRLGRHLTEVDDRGFHASRERFYGSIRRSR